jgi:hypothetical protein
MKTDAGMVLIECNPRPTAGVHVMPEEMFEEALLDKGGKSVRLAEAGTQRKYSVALVRDMLLHFREAWRTLATCSGTRRRSSQSRETCSLRCTRCSPTHGSSPFGGRAACPRRARG